MNVLSLFDGISCGRVALERAEIEVDRYIAYEIDKYATEVSKRNYPDIERYGDVMTADFKKHKNIDIVIGDSPCTYWSIARAGSYGGRETEMFGQGALLFMQFKRALTETKAKYFLYENNYSISLQIKSEISEILGVKPIMINSALVSAQSRKRCYWTNIPGVEQPADRGILLRDILQCGLVEREKAYYVQHIQGNARDYFKKNHTNIAFCPLRIGDIGSGAQAERIYSADAKSVNLCANGGGAGAKTGLYFCPVNVIADGKARTIKAQYGKNAIANFVTNGGFGATAVAERIDCPVIYNRPHGFNKGGVSGDKAPMLTANGKWEYNHGLICPIGDVCDSAGELPPFVCERLAGICEKYGYLPERFNAYNALEIGDKSSTLSTKGNFTDASSVAIIEKLQDELKDVCGKKIYVVENEQICVNGVLYPVKLSDGLYIIRKLTVMECERLQTLPDGYTAGVSDTQRYKCIGNGWTVDVIAHILGYLREA